ncbi:DUF4145 domain-containing protein [Vibrio agarivorans]|uniref:DUF4145 domain-containing protein n=1 Tax=Vibrio agarivorans TaxID=153622 RepID=UPI00222FFE00|nr:DUF4145 domain-containing protein [Vibrio agarivorans]
MSDIEKVVIRTRRLEKLLRVQYHAEGRGLHQLITSCEERLPHDVVGRLRFVATIRNKVVHEEDFVFDEVDDFFSACDVCEEELTPRSNRFIWRAAMWLMVLITMMAMVVYYIHWDTLERFL